MTELMQRPISSEQFELDQQVETLLGKFLDGSITQAETARFENLVAQRSGLMRMLVHRRFRSRLAA